MRTAGRDWKRFVVPLALVAASLTVYGRTLSYPFVLDDPAVVVHNEFLRSPGHFPLLVISDYERGVSSGSGYFRPLMMMSFAVQGILFGWDPGPFHFVNVVLHGLAAWALYLAARALGCGSAGAFAGALLFIVFPPDQESVASVVGRCDILATLFYLLGWRSQILWQRGLSATGRACAAVFGFGLLAMLGKESGVMYVAAIGVTAIFNMAAARNAPGPPGVERAGRGQAAIGLAALMALAVYLVLHHSAVGGIGLRPDVAGQTPNPVAYLAQPLKTWFALYGVGRLLLALLGMTPLSVPMSLTHDGPFPVFTLLDIRVLFPLALVGVLVVIACRWIGRGRPEGLALGVFLLNLVPASNLLVTPAIFVAERYLYLPFAGLALLAAIGWDRAAVRFAGRPERMRLVRVTVSLLVVGWGLSATNRAAIWRSEEAIADNMARAFPWEATWWDRVGRLHLEAGDLEKAWQCFERSATIDPNDAETRQHLGAVILALYREGRLEDAAAAALEASRRFPADPQFALWNARLSAPQTRVPPK